MEILDIVVSIVFLTYSLSLVGYGKYSLQHIDILKSDNVIMNIKLFPIKKKTSVDFLFRIRIACDYKSK